MSPSSFGVGFEFLLDIFEQLNGASNISVRVRGQNEPFVIGSPYKYSHHFIVSCSYYII